jgi:hypothetical protein
MGGRRRQDAGRLLRAEDLLLDTQRIPWEAHGLGVLLRARGRLLSGWHDPRTRSDGPGTGASSPWEVGYLVDEHTFASSHYGDHPQLRGRALPIPYQWQDPGDQLRRQAKAVIDRFIRPRSYILRKADDFLARHLAGHPLIGVHVRGTDASSKNEPRAFRQGSLVLSRYVAEIERLLESLPDARIVVASDEQSSLDHLTSAFADRVVAYDSIRHQGGEAAGQGPTGWIMPAYIAGDRDRAARNGEDAIIEYLLLSQCDHLVHNGSSLARTVLLNAPRLPHTNTHTRRPRP